MRDDLAREIDRAQKVRVNRLVPFFNARRQKSFGRWPAGIGDADVNSTELVRNSIDETVHGGGIRHIQSLGKYFGARLTANLLRRGFEFFATAGAHRHPASFGSKGGGSLAANSLAGTSNNHNPTSQTGFHKPRIICRHWNQWLAPDGGES